MLDYMLALARRLTPLLASVSVVIACSTEPDAESDGGLAIGAVQVLADREEEPGSLAIDDRYVYWTTPHELRRVPLTGGKPTTLVTGDDLRSVVSAGEHVLFIDYGPGTVSRVDREGKQATVIGAGQRLKGLAVAGNRACWADAGGGAEADGSISCATLGGSAAEVISDHLVAPTYVAISGAFVYFTSTSSSCSASSSSTTRCTGGGVNRVPLAGGAPERVDGEGFPVHIVAGELGVYWVSSPRTRVTFLAEGDTKPEMLAELPGVDEGTLAVGADALYLGSGDQVLELSFAGGGSKALITDLGDVSAIAIDDSWLYVATRADGQVLRVRKDGSATEPRPVKAPCPMPVGAAADIAATPRPDANLEQLALHLDAERVTAMQNTYDRVVADVAAIREAAPAVADVTYFAPNDGKTLHLSVSQATFRSIEADLYSAWDCLNDFYEMKSIELLRFNALDSAVLLELEGRYNIDQVAAVYAELPGVESVSPNAAAGDGSTICALRTGSRIEYVVDRAGGDCPDGCTTHDARYFESAAAGVIEAKGRWRSEEEASTPEWFTRVCR